MTIFDFRFAATFLVVLGGLLATLPAWAERADRQKPMNIEADNLRFDDLRQISVFTGNVVLTKGTLIIRGTKVEVRQDAQGYQFGVATAEPGKRAYYRQKRDGVDEFIEGEAEVIDYDGKADLVKFIRKADMRRFKGATVNDEMSGQLITYDNTRDVYTVDGRPTTPGGQATRVRAVLTPAAASQPPSPASSPSAPAALKSSTSLSEGGK
ncbi:MAG TPA: lipopolysaccharide transport periplasmic protein LptA [Burkholderiaceae bacterium]|nr:lipopolysaccharide transport periplasmic protein LptA [Burkholderiaceae bacterium]